MAKYLLLVCAAALLASAPKVYAQTRRVQNKPYIDNRRFHYGFLCGVHSQGINFENNGHVSEATGEQWYAVNDRGDIGLSVGVLGEWRLNKYFALRATPTIHFGQKHLTFREQVSGRETEESEKSTYISAPVDVKFSALRFNNHRPYLLAGFNAMYDLTGHKQDAILTKPLALYAEVGLGCDFYMPFFKLIPEIKFCFGLNDILDKNRKDLVDKSKLVYTEAVSSAKSNMVVLTFYFE